MASQKQGIAPPQSLVKGGFRGAKFSSPFRKEMRKGRWLPTNPLDVTRFVVPLVLSVMVPTALFGGFAAYRAYTTYRAHAEARIVEISSNIANEYDSEFRRVLLGATLIGTHDAFEASPNGLEGTIARLLIRARDFSKALDGARIAVYTVSGETLTEIIAMPTGDQPSLPQHQASVGSSANAVQDIMWTVVLTRAPGISPIFLCPITGQPSLAIVTPVIRDGTVVAVISMTMTLARMQSIMTTSSGRLPLDANAMLTVGMPANDRRTVVARHPSASVGGLPTQTNRQPGKFVSVSSVRNAQSEKGVPILIATHSLQTFPEYSVSVSVPRVTMEGAWLETKKLLLIGALAALGVAIYMIFTFSSYQRKKLRQRILPKEGQLRIALEKTGIGTWEYNTRTGETTWSPEHFDILGYPKEPSGRASQVLWLNSIHPDDRPIAADILAKIRAGAAGAIRQPYRAIHQETGEIRWIESIGYQTSEDTYAGIIIDLTDAKRESEVRMTLAREVDHRSKNLLAVIQSIVQMTRAGSTEALRTALTGRILSLAKTHTLLAQSGWSGASLRDVINNELGGETRVLLDGQHVMLPPNSMQPLAMAIHELATNATKYGSLSVPTGQVTISWKIKHGGLRLVWREEGGPAIDDPIQMGFGTTMIDRTMRHQIEGTIEFMWLRSGLTVFMSIPQDKIAGHASATDSDDDGDADDPQAATPAASAAEHV